METHPRRRWFQFSIKSLMLITLLVAGFFGGYFAGRESMRTKVKEADTRSKISGERANAAARDLRERMRGRWNIVTWPTPRRPSASGWREELP